MRKSPPQITQQLGGIDTRHVHVGEEQLDLLGFKNGHRLLRSVTGANVVAFTAEELAK